MKRKWSVCIPISGAVFFEMEADEEPTFDEAVEHHAERALNGEEPDVEWEYMESMHGEGSVKAGHMHDEYDASECAQHAEKGGDS